MLNNKVEQSIFRIILIHLIKQASSAEENCMEVVVNSENASDVCHVLNKDHGKLVQSSKVKIIFNDSETEYDNVWDIQMGKKLCPMKIHRKIHRVVRTFCHEVVPKEILDGDTLEIHLVDAI